MSKKKKKNSWADDEVKKTLEMMKVAFCDDEEMLAELDKRMIPFMKIIESCDELGWMVAIPPEEDISGIVVGSEEFIEKVLTGGYSEEETEH